MQIGRTLLAVFARQLQPGPSQLFTLINSTSAKMTSVSVSTASGDEGPLSTPILRQILREFGRPDTIKIRDEAKLEVLLSQMIASGTKSLQVIADFDQTLTRQHLNGEKCDALHGVLAYSPKMPQDYRDKTMILYNKYYPIEISPTMPEEVKLPLIIEWYEKSHELITATGVKKEFLRQLVQHSKCVLRDHTTETFKILKENDIPILIFSAGLGDLLEIALEQNQIFHPNVKVVSNYMVFDSTGKIIGFRPPLIHTMNKNEAGLFEGDTYFMDLAHRGNALVLGDNCGDSLMSDGMHEPNAIIKIGFLNDRIEERLATFMDTWDVVLCDDQSMDFLNLILKRIVK
jgi:5'-nucleotidase